MSTNTENLEKALLLHQNNNLKEAEILYKDLLENDSENLNLMYFYSLLLLQTSRGNDTIGYLKKILERNPEGQLLIDCYNLLGETYLNQNEVSLAEQYFYEALKEDQFDLVANFNLGKIHIALQNTDKAIEHFHKALRSDTNQVEIYQNLIKAYLQKNNLDGVINCYTELLKIDPSNAVYYFEMGTYYFKKGDPENAFKSYLNTIYLKPDFVKAHIFLGEIYHRANDLQNAEKHAIKSLELNDNIFEPYLLLGNIYIDSCKPQKAVEISQRGLKKYSGHHSLLFNIARANLLEGNVNEGWEYFKYRRNINEIKGLGPCLLDYNGSLENKTVFVYADTGFGDSLQCLRYLPLLREKGAAVKCKIQAPLVPLLVENGYDIEFIPDDIPHSQVEFDYQINLTSLTYLFKPENGKIHLSSSYLKANPEKVLYYKEKYFDNDCFKVGISWQGSGITPVHRLNNIEHVKTFIPFVELKNVKIYSVLKGQAEKQLEELPENIDIINLGQTFNNFSDTAAALENLDLLIVSDAAYSHLGGALGKETWVMIPYVPNWRWSTKTEDSAWYDSLKLFRQSQKGCWDDVIDRIYSELKLRLSK